MCPSLTISLVLGLSAGRGEDSLPKRARDLFDGDSCAWVEYYGDTETLEAVRKLYKKDYNHHHWYTIDTWKEKLQACLDTKRRE